MDNIYDTTYNHADCSLYCKVSISLSSKNMTDFKKQVIIITVAMLGYSGLIL
jgi:hypothetical protein